MPTPLLIMPQSTIEKQGNKPPFRVRLFTWNNFLLFISVVIPLGGCSIKYGFTGGSVPADAKTISVAYFESNAPLAAPNTGQLFTERLRELFLTQTSLDLVSSGGDLQFEGFINRYEVTPVGIQAGSETASQNRLTIAVKVKYTNTLDETQNYDMTFSRFADFNSTTELSSVEETLIREINDQLVQDIYDKAFSNW